MLASLLNPINGYPLGALLPASIPIKSIVGDVVDEVKGLSLLSSGKKELLFAPSYHARTAGEEKRELNTGWLAFTLVGFLRRLA